MSKQIVPVQVSSWLGLPSQKTEQRNVRKNDDLERLSHVLDRAREKRDALASERDALASNLTALNAQISELEARLSEEQDRRERERVGREIEGIKERLQDSATAFASATAGLCDATETAAAVVPGARDLNSFLRAVAPEADTAIDLLLRELHRRGEAVRAGQATLQLPQPVNRPPDPPKNNDLLLRLARRAERIAKP
jgi:predicted  nucleic acid-binding Zn-ribbon protein